VSAKLNQNKFEVVCDNGCEKVITSKQEFETHYCVRFLLGEMEESNKQRETMTVHLKEADNDIDNLLSEFERAKDE